MDLSKSQDREKGDRREHKRLDCERTTFFATKEKLFEGFVKNISLGGVFVQSSGGFFPGDVLTLAVPCASNEDGFKLKEPHNDQDIKMKGRVIWRNQEGFGMEFIKT